MVCWGMWWGRSDPRGTSVHDESLNPFSRSRGGGQSSGKNSARIVGDGRTAAEIASISGWVIVKACAGETDSRRTMEMPRSGGLRNSAANESRNGISPAMWKMRCFQVKMEKDSFVARAFCPVKTFASFFSFWNIIQTLGLEKLRPTYKLPRDERKNPLSCRREIGKFPGRGASSGRDRMEGWISRQRSRCLRGQSK